MQVVPHRKKSKEVTGRSLDSAASIEKGHQLQALGDLTKISPLENSQNLLQHTSHWFNWNKVSKWAEEELLLFSIYFYFILFFFLFLPHFCKNKIEKQELWQYRKHPWTCQLITNTSTLKYIHIITGIKLL